MNVIPQQFYTRKELAELLRVSVETIDRWRKIGTLKGITIEGSVRFSQEEVDGLVERGAK